MSITGNVIYFTIYDNFDRKNIKITSIGTFVAQINKMLKMTLAPPGGRGEILKVRQIVKETTRNDLLIFVRG